VVEITVAAPDQVVLRAINDAQRNHNDVKLRDALQTLYQMTMVKLVANKGYDEADGRMVDETGADPGQGLNGSLIDTMSSLIEGS
jgi:hypothetical protein